MFIAMNRFKVIRGSETAFEDVWLSRDTHLDKVPGFVEFHLSRAPRLKTTRYMRHIRCGKTAPPLKRGRNQRPSVPRVPAPAKISRSTLVTRSSRGSNHSDRRKRQEKDGVVLTSGVQTSAIEIVNSDSLSVPTRA